MKLASPLLLPYRCHSPDCKRRPQMRESVTFLPGSYEPCPHCGERGFFKKLAIIHLIQPSQFGVIKVSRFAEQWCNQPGNLRLQFLCEKAAKGYRDPTRSPNQPRQYTHVRSAATCYYCLKEYDRNNFPDGKIITEY